MSSRCACCRIGSTKSTGECLVETIGPAHEAGKPVISLATATTRTPSVSVDDHRDAPGASSCCAGSPRSSWGARPGGAGLTLASLLLVFGAYALIDGVLAIGAGLGMIGGLYWWLVLGGAAAIVIGVLTFASPATTTIALVYFIAAW
jgi:hypothetical protein